MSAREWQPGDVVAATVNGRPNVRLVAGWSKYAPELRWCELSPRWADGDDDECWFMPHVVTDARPLVVIDPEDREQVERLAKALRDGDRNLSATSIPAVQAALRAFANPKPEEPTGLGAVIEDAEGFQYVRGYSDGETFTHPWHVIDPCASKPMSWWKFADIDVVRVLAVGVIA